MVRSRRLRVCHSDRTQLLNQTAGMPGPSCRSARSVSSEHFRVQGSSRPLRRGRRLRRGLLPTFLGRSAIVATACFGAVVIAGGSCARPHPAERPRADRRPRRSAARPTPTRARAHATEDKRSRGGARMIPFPAIRDVRGRSGSMNARRILVGEQPSTAPGRTTSRAWTRSTGVPATVRVRTIRTVTSSPSSARTARARARGYESVVPLWIRHGPFLPR